MVKRLGACADLVGDVVISQPLIGDRHVMQNVCLSHRISALSPKGQSPLRRDTGRRGTDTPGR